MDAISRERRAGQGLRRVSSGPEGRPLPGWRSRTRWIIGREPLVFCLDHLPGSRSCGGRDVLRDRPQKRRHLAGNCGNDQRTLFADGGEPTVTGAQANLRLPGDFANRFGQPLEPRLQGLADAGRIPVAPGTLDQYPPGTFVAGQCVRPARRTRSPVDRSDGTRPRKAISGRGLSNRRKSPISETKVTATPRRRRASLDRLRPPAPSTSSARFPPLVGRAGANAWRHPRLRLPRPGKQSAVPGDRTFVAPTSADASWSALST